MESEFLFSSFLLLLLLLLLLLFPFQPIDKNRGNDLVGRDRMIFTLTSEFVCTAIQPCRDLLPRSVGPLTTGKTAVDL